MRRRPAGCSIAKDKEDGVKRSLMLFGLAGALAAPLFLFACSKADAPSATTVSLGVARVTPPSGAVGEVANDLDPANSPATARSSGLALPELEITPEVYSHLAENPFRCGPRPATDPCDWQFDPTVARSPAEARWMAAYGYPTTDEREWASRRSTEALITEARRTGSPALWALALQRRVVEAGSSDDAEAQARVLRRVAEQGRSLFALEEAAIARLHVVDLIIDESAAHSEGERRIADVEMQMSIALSDAAMAAALGDPAAMVRILQRAPADLPTAYGVPLNAMTPAYAAEQIADAHIALRQNQALSDRGAMPVRRFVVSDIALRPAPVRDRDGSGRDAWTGER